MIFKKKILVRKLRPPPPPLDPMRKGMFFHLKGFDPNSKTSVRQVLEEFLEKTDRFSYLDQYISNTIVIG